MSQAAKRENDRVIRFDAAGIGGMNIKSYYARSIEEAVDRATYEMGPEAMLIDSRRTPAEARHIGEYEVRFADSGRSRPEPRAAAPSAEAGLAEEVARMRSEIGEMRELFRKRAVRRREPGHGGMWDRLIDAGFSPDLARELAALESEQALEAELQRRLAAFTPATAGPELPAVAVIGPPGSGKTTAIIKMAVRHCASGQGPAILVNTDTYRIGAAEQMARYASILGMPLLTADTAAGLRQVMDTRAANALLLIDTPGLSGGDMEMFEPAGRYLAGRSDVDRQLVLPATMHWSDMARITRRYERYQPTRLAFSHLDETDRFGALLSATCGMAVPVAWLSAGQRIPDDLEPATPESLSRLAAARPAEDGPDGAMERTAS